MATADERVKRIGCMVRRSEMEEGFFVLKCKRVKEFCIVCVVNLCDFEPVKRFEMKFLSFCDSTSSRVENELMAIELLTIDIEKKRVAVV